ncbi:MAG: hypothetical protein COA91_12680 [Robiginitomaculum sp.]|nr:MAG: hypothetical protein COA91_12680 [Robiginitomaculum sp.]
MVKYTSTQKELIEKVKQAFIRFDDGERQEGRGTARTWFVKGDNGKLYPAKHIWGLATGRKYFQTHSSSKNGVGATEGLSNIGFTIIPKSKKQVAKAIEDIAYALNDSSKNYNIGKLQDVRKTLKGLKRKASNVIFHNRTIFDEFAFHDGGRTELQFNIGFEQIDNKKTLRYGVAISLELGQSLHSIEDMLPNIKLYNDFLRSFPDAYGDMFMWRWLGDQRSVESYPTPIPENWIEKGAFIFLGKSIEVNAFDANKVLSDFDRLLPLYQYVESFGEDLVEHNLIHMPFAFKSGFSKKKNTTKANAKEKTLNVSLRHNELQYMLCGRLAKKFGASNVSDEVPNGVGGSIDVVVKHQKTYWFYEIKTHLTARACIREAFGQLLEYSKWPGTQSAQKLIIIAEAVLDVKANEYLKGIRKKYNIPIYYEQIKM